MSNLGDLTCRTRMCSSILGQESIILSRDHVAEGWVMNEQALLGEPSALQTLFIELAPSAC